MDYVTFAYSAIDSQLDQENAGNQELGDGTAVHDNFDDLELGYSLHTTETFNSTSSLTSNFTETGGLGSTINPLMSPHFSAPKKTNQNWLSDFPENFESAELGVGNASDLFSMPTAANSESKKRVYKGARLSDFDELLLGLKAQNPGASWAQIAEFVQKSSGKSYQLPALQMRYKRIRQRLLDESMDDDEFLQAAVKYWKEEKWEIISDKMSQLQPGKDWTGETCRKKWLQLKLQNIDVAKSRGSDSFNSLGPMKQNVN